MCKLTTINEQEDAFVPIIVTKLCATLEMKPGCSYVPEDLTLKFPTCCPLLVCVDDEIINIVESIDAIDSEPTEIPQITELVERPIRLTPEDVPTNMDVDDYLEQIRFQIIKKKKPHRSLKPNNQNDTETMNNTQTNQSIIN
ncbi:uncharacterized protein LOC123292794 [Chrysoperla carnea]|uniref:uncharacterized protein LOC123292794 n=1 Tax=Chrysoperla carnea TaxID=189513 RepID=UPI001D05D1F4|nr:uncharacterized protein LOC123292794 [Chrysoperla carnea]